MYMNHPALIALPCPPAATEILLRRGTPEKPDQQVALTLRQPSQISGYLNQKGRTITKHPHKHNREALV